jgi:Family of unknown function (DUF6152)
MKQGGMMRAGFLGSLVVGAGLLLGTAPAFAHHSFAAEYDSAKPVTVTGTVTKVEWMNPHARFYIDAKDDSGTVTKWEFELGSPNGLMRQGWTRHSLKEGDTVTVSGFLAKDGSRLANARTVKLADGRKVFAGSATDGGPKQ